MSSSLYRICGMSMYSRYVPNPTPTQSSGDEVWDNLHVVITVLIRRKKGT